jgi:DNA-binding Lrp family transcriptional regulator
MDELDKEIIDAVKLRKENPPSIREIAKLFSKKYGTIRNRIYTLEREGFLRTSKQRDRVLVRINRRGHVEAQSEGD